MTRSELVYVLITPARNEAAFIDLTIRSVLSQTVLPARWVIVSDGSTDGTDDIVAGYAKAHSWIQLVQMPPRQERHFGGKVGAFNAGYAALNGASYDLLGNLDGDISLEAHYFESLLEQFAVTPRLGIAGVVFVEAGRPPYDFRFSSISHVSGASQLFRRACFEEIGGYRPLPKGGIDVVACLTARMHGWQTRTFPDLLYTHHKPMGTGNYGRLGVWWKLGEKDYSLGRHPLWEACRCAYQMTRPPFVAAGSLTLAGYFYSLLRRVPCVIPEALVNYQRREQMARLRRSLTLKFGAKRAENAEGVAFGRAGTVVPGQLLATPRPSGDLKYVLVTAARNEAQFIQKTLESVIHQTLRPQRWIIVSDGSVDGTDDIVRRYAAEHNWIELMRMPERAQRHFGGKAAAFNAGCAKLQSGGFQFVANLDADISLPPDFFAWLLAKFEEYPKLGLAGAPFVENGQTYDYRFASVEHVSGQCQMFRRECLEEIGGYSFSPLGGVDVIAVISARMKGWQTRTFVDKNFEHHRLMGQAMGGVLGAKFRLGEKDYLLGWHPLWELGRGIYQMKYEPVFLGGALMLAGYAWGGLRRLKRPVSAEFVRFQRREQLERMRRLFWRKARLGAAV